MINEETPRIYFNPGNIVKVKHDKLENVPVMYVVEKVTRTISHKDNENMENVFVGVKCRWFDINQQMHEAIFSTKDLIHV